jgi:hypothetical protein
MAAVFAMQGLGQTGMHVVVGTFLLSTMETLIPMLHTVESYDYAPPFCMLALGKSGEGAYTRDSDISAWRPLPTDECQMGAWSLHFLWLFDGQNLRKMTK